MVIFAVLRDSYQKKQSQFVRSAFSVLRAAYCVLGI
jgi:hypothetical protein